MSRWHEQKKLVLETTREILAKGLVVGKAGNISLRLPPLGKRELLAITPASRYYESLTVDDIQVIDFKTGPVEGDQPPSSETMLHIGIYRSRKNINAVIHTHSVFASAISVAGLEIPAILDDQVVFLGGEIKLAAQAIPGSRESVANIISALGGRNAVLLPNHGAVGIGRTLKEALTACELLEKTAKVYLHALALGRVNTLPPESVEAEKVLFAKLQSAETE